MSNSNKANVKNANDAVKLSSLHDLQLAQVIAQIKDDMSEDDLLSCYNFFADCNGYERIELNDGYTINEIYTSAHDALLSSFYGSYNPTHPYFILNGYANFQTFEYLLSSEDSPIDLSQLANWLIAEDKCSDYGLEIVTLDSMYDDITYHLNYDNISLKELLDLSEFLGLQIDDSYYIDDLKNTIFDFLYNNEKSLLITINYLGL